MEKYYTILTEYLSRSQSAIINSLLKQQYYFQIMKQWALLLCLALAVLASAQIINTSGQLDHTNSTLTTNPDQTADDTTDNQTDDTTDNQADDTTHNQADDTTKKLANQGAESDQPQREDETSQGQEGSQFQSKQQQEQQYQKGAIPPNNTDEKPQAADIIEKNQSDTQDNSINLDTKQQQTGYNQNDKTNSQPSLAKDPITYTMAPNVGASAGSSLDRKIAELEFQLGLMKQLMLRRKSDNFPK